MPDMAVDVCKMQMKSIWIQYEFFFSKENCFFAGNHMGIEVAEVLLNAFFIPATSINTNYETWKGIKRKIYKEYNEINVKVFWLAFVFFFLVHW